ncbi:MAG: biotin transporter BioY [Clostridia bacterium]|nr:biotin transporter BioY [Clostridia bacterium]
MAKVATAEKRSNRTLLTRRIAYTAVLTAIIAVTSQIAFHLPSGIPVTLQTFSVALSGYFGGIWGVAAVFIYLLLGLVGVPVFAYFKGGFSAIVGVTGGYLVGFIPMAIISAIPVRVKNNALRHTLKLFLGLVGLAFCHLFGALWFGYTSGSGVERAFAVASLPYLVKDVASVFGGYVLSEILKKRLKASL